MARPALLLIDWQQAFRDLDFWGARNNPAAEANARRLLERWRALGSSVIHVRHASVEPGSPLSPDAPGAAFEPFAEPIEGETVIQKQVNAAFIGTNLETELRARGVDALIVTGVTTDHCVSTTVRMAANLGFAVALAGDACFTFDRETPDGRRLSAQSVHDAHIASLNGEFARVLSTASILAEHA